MGGNRNFKLFGLKRILKGFLVTVKFETHKRPVHIGGTITGADPKGDVVIGKRFFKLVEVEIDVPAVHIWIAVIRVYPYGRCIIGNGEVRPV